MRGDRDVVQRVLAEQPAFRSWLLFCLREVLSIAPPNGVSTKQKEQKGWFDQFYEELGKEMKFVIEFGKRRKM